MAVDIYDATLEDVDQLLVWDVFTSSEPEPTMVELWIQIGAAELQGLIGDIAADLPCGTEAARLRARHIVALYAAAMAEDAHYPERTSDRDAGDYGARLWARHKEQSAAFAAAIEACRDGISTDSPHGGIAHSFPAPPMFIRTMGS